MKTVNSVDWELLLESNSRVSRLVNRWATGNMTSREVTTRLSGTKFAGAFRHLVRSNGTTYGRRLARKAFSYRGNTVTAS